jgi:uncharacterized membrane protein HdeD (DUF308 family)
MESSARELTVAAPELRKQWGWCVALGALLVLVGIYAISSGTAATIASILVLGAAIFVAGIFQIAAAFAARGAGHVILALLTGVLDSVVGLMLVQHPGVGALTITLLLAALFVFGGLYRLVIALWLQFPHYGWVACSGLVTFALGVMLWMQWPLSAEWFIGFAVGLNFIFTGIAWSTLGWKLKQA